MGNIRYACEAASNPGDEVRVAQGAYSFDGTTIQLVPGVTLKGGYIGNGDEASSDASLTILDASGVAAADAEPFLEGLIPTENRTIISGMTFQGSKVGALIIRANTTLDNIIVKDNEISGEGAAGVRVKLDFDGDEIRILNSLFTGNKITSADAGGAIVVGGESDETGLADVLIKNCLVKENEAAVETGGNWSAGVYFGGYINESAKLNIINTVFDSNSGVAATAGTSYACAAIGTKNSSSSSISNAALNIINCTAINNTNIREGAATSNSASFLFRYMAANIYNTVFVGNTNGSANNSNANIYIGGSTKGVSISNSAFTPDNTVTSSATRTDNITTGTETLADVFVPNSYIPFATSPLVDTGSATAGQFSDTDFLGKAIYGSKRDIGAYEYVGGTAIRPTAVKGEIIATYYLNLQGVKVGAPLESGVYLVKRVYDSGETVISKELTLRK
jgi:hypothetical protein